MTKQEQIDEMAKYICNACEMGHGFDGCSYGGREHYKRCSITQKTAKALYNAGYRKIDEFEKCRKCPAWSGTDCTRNPYTESCLDDKVNLKNEIKRLEKENEQLKAKLEARLTCDFVKTAQKQAQNKKYSIFNSVRKEFADEVKAKLLAIFGKTICSDLDTEDITDIIDELLKEYE